MWAVAGALLGAFVVLSVLGGLAGPHLHLGSLLAGAAAAVALVIIALTQADADLAWALLGLDLFLSTGVGLSAWRSVRQAHLLDAGRPAGSVHALSPPLGSHRSLVGAEATAVGALQPEGVVRVSGEQWSAVSLNGTVPPGGRVQVIGQDGIRLEVWNEDIGALGLSGPDWPTGGEGQEATR